MKRQELQLLARYFSHAGRPAAVSPPDDLNRRIRSPHRLRKLHCFSRGGLEVEAIPVIGRFVADLPVPDAERRSDAVSPALCIRRIIAIGHPSCGFLRVSRSNRALVFHVLPTSIGFEVHADEGIGTHSPAEIHELAGPDLVRLNAAPQKVHHGWPRLTGTDALSPAIEIRKDPAPSHHRRSKFARHRHYIIAPLLGEVIPRSFDGSVGGPQRLHELHIKVGGQLEAENRVDDKSVRVERLGRRAGTLAKGSR